MISSCSFVTERLVVTGWHSALTDAQRQTDPAAVVAAMLSDAVTRPLPPPWHGPYSVRRAREWIAERDAEGTTLLATEKGGGTPLALLFLAESESDDRGAAEVRLGYLVAEEAWGRGVATELVRGFVAWCRQTRPAATIAAGVDADNAPSARVLQKAGFERVVEDGDDVEDGHLYRLRL
jgi:RimJ/RimL family protein N-acetyltransferase